MFIVAYPCYLVDLYGSDTYLLYNYELDFTEGKNQQYLISGWSIPEAWGVWSDGDAAEIQFSIPKSPVSDINLIIKGGAFLHGSHTQQEIDIIVNNQYVSSFLYEFNTNKERTITILREIAGSLNGVVRILFKFKTPKAPIDVGYNLDNRQLGLAIWALQVKRNFSDTDPFEKVITLGEGCGVKVQTNLYFSAKFPGKERNYTGGGYLFDYMVPANLGLLAEAISNRLEGCCDQSMVVREIYWARGAVPRLFTPVDTRYDMHFSHLFDQHPVVKGAENVTQASFNRYFPDILPKITYLKNKIIFNAHRTLYIVWGAKSTKQQEFSEANIIKLRDAISFLRRDDNFCLLVWSNKNLNFGNMNMKNILYKNGYYWGENPWTELTPGFAEIMDEFNFVPDENVGELYQGV